MEVLFETRADIIRVGGRMYFFQAKPKIHPEPVLVGDCQTDGMGASLYGSVIRDGGVYRMWYQAWPETWTEDGVEWGGDVAMVGYAESDDGIHWRKPVLNRVEHQGSKKNNLVNLAVHTPSVFIDPTAPATHRYRGTGCIDSRYENHFPLPNPPLEGAYFTFHSADGFHWEVDSPEPTWMWADNIFSIWHPGRGQGEALYKRMPHMGGMARRSWHSATLKNGAWSRGTMEALVPDDYDDVLARASGHLSADYYGITMMPAGEAMVGFLVQFRHRHPLHPDKLHGGVIGKWGETDITLVYQPKEGARWLHPSGRPNFLTHGDVPWSRNGWYVGSVVDCGDEQRLYLTGAVGGHIHKRPDEKESSRIGFVSWPKWRLFEFRAEPEGDVEIDLGELKEPVEFVLNYTTCSVGKVQAQVFSAKPLYTLEEVEGRRKEDGIVLEKESLGEVVRWKNGSVIQPYPGRHTVIRIFLEHASIYAYELRSVAK